MINYPISSNFSKNIFSATFSALHYYFLHFKSSLMDDYLFTSFQQKNKHKMEFKHLLFCEQMND